MTKIEHVTAATYSVFITSAPVAIVHFWAAWDGRFLFQRLQVELAMNRFQSSDVRASMFDTDDQFWSPLNRELKISTVPTLLFYRQGQLATRLAGNRDVETVAANISQLLTPTAGPV